MPDLKKLSMDLFWRFHNTYCAILATSFHLSETSLATGPLIIVPLGFPFSSFSKATALSSKHTLSPVNLLYDFLCLMITASNTWPFISGFPALTETFTQSATFAYCCLPFFDFPCLTPVILTILAPLLSAAKTLLPICNPLVTFAITAFILLPPVLADEHLLFRPSLEFYFAN